ncbi:MAG: hypothetical protein Q4C49_08705 [Bacillota bacterium]|nr:hypothetical protein [Bacillota bacterium]
MDSIFVTLSLDVNVGIAEFFAVQFCSLLNGGNIDLRLGSVFYTISLFLSFILSLLLTLVFSDLLKKLKAIGKIHSNYKWILLILPITVFFLIMNMTDYLYVVENSIVYIINISVLVVANYVTLWLYIQSLDSLKKADELQRIKQNIQAQNEKHELMASHYENSFSFLHNLLHECAKMENSDTSQIKEIANRISKDIVKKFNLFYTDSYPLKIVLSQYSQELEKHDILFNSTVTNLSDIIGEVDQTFIFSCLIQTAINACTELANQNKYINLYSKKQMNGIVLQCIFTTKTEKKIDVEYIKSNYYVIQKSEWKDGVQVETIFIGKA